jgi:GNAT superfamily N-acetyltransferase
MTEKVCNYGGMCTCCARCKGLFFNTITFDSVKTYLELHKRIFPNNEAILHALAACGLETFKHLSGININAGRSEYIIVFADTSPIGITGIYTYADSHNPKECWLAWFGIRPEFRGKKYGEAALRWTMARAHVMGYEVFRLWTSDEEHPEAVALYGKLGMVRERMDEDVVYSKQLNHKPFDTNYFHSPNIEQELALCNAGKSKIIEVCEKYEDAIPGITYFYMKRAEGNDE